jgi:hypothetical protein
MRATKDKGTRVKARNILIHVYKRQKRSITGFAQEAKNITAKAIKIGTVMLHQDTVTSIQAIFQDYIN